MVWQPKYDFDYTFTAQPQVLDWGNCYLRGVAVSNFLQWIWEADMELILRSVRLNSCILMIRFFCAFLEWTALPFSLSWCQAKHCHSVDCRRQMDDLKIYKPNVPLPLKFPLRSQAHAKRTIGGRRTLRNNSRHIDLDLEQNLFRLMLTFIVSLENETQLSISWEAAVRYSFSRESFAVCGVYSLIISICLLSDFLLYGDIQYDRDSVSIYSQLRSDTPNNNIPYWKMQKPVTRHNRCNVMDVGHCTLLRLIKATFSLTQIRAHIFS